MMREVAEMHRKALPHTLSSRIGVKFVQFLYKQVAKIGFVKTVEKKGQIVGAVSGVGSLILTLVVDPLWQRQGVGSELIGKLNSNLWVYTERESVGFYKKLGFREIMRIGRIILLWRK